jgi:hypothetical protein
MYLLDINVMKNLLKTFSESTKVRLTRPTRIEEASFLLDYNLNTT